MSDKPRMWKFLGIIHCPDCMIAVQYAIPRIDGDIDSEGEEMIMAAAVQKVHDAGPGYHAVMLSPSARYVFRVYAHPVREHPMQARQWLGEH